MKIGIFAGSFCPVTVGHVDAIRRAAKLVDKLYVVVGVNIAKKYVMPDEARLQSVVAATSDIPNVECALHKGLLVDYARKVGATVMIKVVRNATESRYVGGRNGVYRRRPQSSPCVQLSRARVGFARQGLLRIRAASCIADCEKVFRLGGTT